MTGDFGQAGPKDSGSLPAILDADREAKAEFGICSTRLSDSASHRDGRRLTPADCRIDNWNWSGLSS
jgi:hypothetical protein